MLLQSPRLISRQKYVFGTASAAPGQFPTGGSASSKPEPHHPHQGTALRRRFLYGNIFYHCTPSTIRLTGAKQTLQ
jgi:hypothetical protein